MTLVAPETAAPPTQLIDMLRRVQRCRQDSDTVRNTAPVAWLGDRVDHSAPHFSAAEATDARTMGWVIHFVLSLASRLDQDEVALGCTEAAYWELNGILPPDLSAALEKIV